jgi:DNA-binding winged helix-turn-helix (wHTH) protein
VGIAADVGPPELRQARRRPTGQTLPRGQPVALTTIELDLLLTLARDAGVVFSRHRLLDRVWGMDYVGDEHVVDVHLGNLRRKLGDDAVRPTFIETVRGAGYRFRSEEGRVRNNGSGARCSCPPGRGRRRGATLFLAVGRAPAPSDHDGSRHDRHRRDERHDERARQAAFRKPSDGPRRLVAALRRSW